MAPKTFCALPFHQMTVMNDGKVRLCCRSEVNITSDGRDLSLHHATLGQIWNSDYLRSVRRRMLSGLGVQDCLQCYATEAGGATSLRQVMNARFASLLDATGEEELLKRTEGCLDSGDNMPFPSALHLWLGNHCNLKCRMCSPMFSSRIAADAVHAAWFGGPEGAAVYGWQEDVFEEILQHAKYVKLIQFSGGEPFIHRTFRDILRKLVETRDAAHIELYITSNGMTHSGELSSLLAHFPSVELGISVDGLGTLQEYIRFPSQWDALKQNISSFQKDKVPISIRPTVQAYNVFGLLDVARWCDTNGLRFVLDNILSAPGFLSLDMLPDVVILKALQEWEQYFQTECREDNRWHVGTVISALRRPRAAPDKLAVLQNQFIRFTNDLDGSRGQSFAAACPELYDQLTAAGFRFRTPVTGGHPALPKTFCVLPFSQLTIANDGKAKLCTHTHAIDMISEGRSLSLHSTPLEEIWNSTYLRTVRRRMVEGSPVKDCWKCYQTEAEGGTSLRQTMNLHAGCRADGTGEDDVFEKARKVVTQNSASAPPPSALHLWLGNLCNLKCRMCSPVFSSRVASDPVQSKWLGGLSLAETPSRIPQHVYWSQSEQVVFEEVFNHPESLRWVHFSGGEPLLHRSFLPIVQKLVDGGHASHIRVYINSNGTVYSHRLSSLLKEFSSVELAVSLDGIGKLQEYIRPPSKWDKVCRNVFAFHNDGIPVSVRPTVQAYNVFDLPELARWCETKGLPFFLDNVLMGPRFLSFDMLPKLVADEALQCWMQYLNAECTDTNRWHVETVIAALRRPRPEAKAISSLQQQFLQFTRDMDRSAGQLFAIACPGLYERLVAAGLDFSPRVR